MVIMKRNSIAVMATIGALAFLAAMVPSFTTAVYAQVSQSNNISNSESGSSSALGHVTSAGPGGVASSSGNTNALVHQGACLQGANSIGGHAINHIHRSNCS